MKPPRPQALGLIVFSLLYPATALITQHIPNPMVPGATVALNMIFPVLSGRVGCALI
jgi:hypothetical protein